MKDMNGMDGNHAMHTEQMQPTPMQMFFTTKLPFTLLFEPWEINTTGKLLASFFGSLFLAMLYEAFTNVRERLLLRAACQAECPPTILSSEANAGPSCPSCPNPNPNDSGKHLVQPDGVGKNQQFRLLSGLRSRRFNRCLSQSSFCNGIHLLQTLLHMIQMFVSYMLMLIVMTYNVYMLISVLLGLTLGYFIFSRNRPLMIRSPQCCH